MTIRRTLATILTATALLATAVEYALLTTDTSTSVATGGIIISEN